MRGSRWRAVAALAALLVGVAGCGDRSVAPRADHRPMSPPAASSPPPSTPAPAAEGNGDPVPPSLSQAPGPTGAMPPGRMLGADASWPQCPEGMGIPQKRTEGRPMPTSAARFVVLGLTNGVSFVANPCLDDQVRWVKDRHLMAAAYSVLTYPDDRTLARQGRHGPFPGGTRLGALRNVGYQAALYNVDTMHRADLQTPVIWIDVEPVTAFDWSPDVVANAAVVQGMERGYRDAGFRTGYYSIGSLWTGVVGPLRTGAPEWRPAGERGLAEALRRCRADWSFQGGPGVIGQWIEAGRDRNVICPGAITDLRQWFHQY